MRTITSLRGWILYHDAADLPCPSTSELSHSARSCSRVRQQRHHSWYDVPRQHPRARHRYVLPPRSPACWIADAPAVSSPIRMVATDGPVTNVSDPDLACGVGALAAPIDAPVYPGSAINFTWVSGSGGNVRTTSSCFMTVVGLSWRILVVAARGRAGPDIHDDVRKRDDVCGVQRVGRGVVQDRGGCEAGGEYVLGPAAHQWVISFFIRCARANLLLVEGDNYNVTIPEGLAPGAYLIRNEVSGPFPYELDSNL